MGFLVCLHAAIVVSHICYAAMEYTIVPILPQSVSSGCLYVNIFPLATIYKTWCEQIIHLQHMFSYYVTGTFPGVAFPLTILTL